MILKTFLIGYCCNFNNQKSVEKYSPSWTIDVILLVENLSFSTLPGRTANSLQLYKCARDVTRRRPLLQYSYTVAHMGLISADLWYIFCLFSYRYFLIYWLTGNALVKGDLTMDPLPLLTVLEKTVSPGKNIFQFDSNDVTAINWWRLLIDRVCPDVTYYWRHQWSIISLL